MKLENSLTQPHTNTRTIKHKPIQSHAASCKHTGNQTPNNTVSRSRMQTHGQSNRKQSHAASYKHTGNQTRNNTVSRSLIQTHGQSDTKQYSLTQPRIDSDSPSCQSVTDTLFPSRPLSLTFPRFRHFQPP